MHALHGAAELLIKQRTDARGCTLTASVTAKGRISCYIFKVCNFVVYTTQATKMLSLKL